LKRNLPIIAEKRKKCNINKWNCC